MVFEYICLFFTLVHLLQLRKYACSSKCTQCIMLTFCKHLFHTWGDLWTPKRTRPWLQSGRPVSGAAFPKFTGVRSVTVDPVECYVIILTRKHARSSLARNIFRICLRNNAIYNIRCSLLYSYSEFWCWILSVFLYHSNIT